MFQTTLALSNIRLSLASSPWLYVGLALAAIAFAFAVYRFTLPPVSTLRRTALWVLRGVALVLLLLLLFEPVLSYLRERSLRPTVAVLVDQSASMSDGAAGDARAAVVRRLLQSDALNDLRGKSNLRFYAFADSVREVSRDSLQALPFTGVGTDLAGNWQRVEKTLAEENLAAIVLLSDGAQNIGENPVRAAQESPAPIYAVGVGDTTVRADAALAELLTNDVTYAGRRVPVDIRVRARELAGRQSVVRLLGPRGIELDRQPVQFSGADDELTVSLGFQAETAGDMRVEAVLDSVPGELIRENNRRSAIIRVLEEKSRVLLVAGSPSPDVTMLAQTLEADTAISVRTAIEIAGGRYLGNEPEPAVEDIERAKLIVLIDYPARSSSRALSERLARAASQRQIPLILFAGPHLDLSRLTEFADVLPLDAAKPTLSEERVTARAAASHPALSGTGALPAEWSELPPVLGGVGNFSARGSAQVVVKLSRETLGIQEDEPGIILWQNGGQRGAAFLFWNHYLWKLQLAQNTAQAAFYDELVSRLVAWLVAPAEQERVRITAGKKLYSGGERVRLLGQVYGADLAPRDDASVSVQVTSGTQTETVPLRSRGNGRYEGEFNPWGEGEYRFSGAAVAAADTLGSDRGIFAVEAFNIELIDTRARFDLLRQIAAASQGSFAPASAADTMLRRLDLAPRTVTARRETPLWNKGAMVWAIIALLSVEWILRKRSGML